MKLLLSLLFAGLASGQRGRPVCSDDQFYSYFSRRCRRAPTEGQYCNLIKTCAGRLTCDENECKNLIPLDDNPERWDVHFHFIPEDYREELRAILAPNDQDFGAVARFEALAPNYHNITLAALEAEELNIQRVTMSCPLGTHYFEPTKAATLTSYINDVLYNATQAPEANGKFEFFAHLPPFTDEAAVMAEIDRVVTRYGNTKFGMLTQYPSEAAPTFNNELERYYVTDPRFAPIWEKLNSIKAIVTIHPTEVDVHPEEIPSELPSMVPQPAMVYAFDTARVSHSIVVTNHMSTYPDVKIIVTHGGGEYPVTNFRACAIAVQLQYQFACFGPPNPECFMEPDQLGILRVKPEFEPQYEADVAAMQERGRQLYYDLSLTTGPSVLALLEYLGPDHDHQIMYGSDAGYVSPWETSLFDKDMIGALNRGRMNDKFQLRRMIQWENAKAFFEEFDQSTPVAQ